MMWLIIAWGFIGIAAWVWLMRSTGGGPVTSHDLSLLALFVIMGPFALALVGYDIHKNPLIYQIEKNERKKK